MYSCSNAPKDPAAEAPNFDIKVERFDSAFFSIDTLQTKRCVDQLLKNYPGFGIDFFTRILMLKNTEDTNSIKAFYRTHYPIYSEVQKVNAIKTAKPALEAAFKRIHYYFPKYKLTNNIILFVGPLESYGNILTTNAIAVGLQMHMGANSKWYFDEHIQTIYPTYLSRRYTPEYIALSSVQNVINDIYLPANKSPNFITQMIEAGKTQYVINACFPNTADSIKYGYTKEHSINIKSQESQLWTYILHEKLTYSTNPNDMDNFLQDAESSSIFGEAMPGNVGKYIGLKIIESWMQQKSQSGISLELMLNTPADKIFESANYNP
jgi:hypothetical protein